MLKGVECAEGGEPASIDPNTKVSDFSIFKHNLGKEFEGIYAQTRAALPSISDDEASDDDGDVEVLDAGAV